MISTNEVVVYYSLVSKARVSNAKFQNFGSLMQYHLPVHLLAKLNLRIAMED